MRSNLAQLREWRWSAVVVFSWVLSAVAVRGEEWVRFDFETGDLQGWRVVEGQFDYLVSDRPLFHNTYATNPDRKYNKQGKYYLSTVEQQPGRPSNDRMTGVVESPVFVLTGPEMSMLVGSGTQRQGLRGLVHAGRPEVLVGRGTGRHRGHAAGHLARAATGRPEGVPASRRPRDRRLGARHVRRLHRRAAGSMPRRRGGGSRNCSTRLARRAACRAALAELNLPACAWRFET